MLKRIEEPNESRSQPFTFLEYGLTVKYKWFSGNIMLRDYRQHEIQGGMVTEGERKFMQEDVIRVYYIRSIEPW